MRSRNSVVVRFAIGVLMCFTALALMLLAAGAAGGGPGWAVASYFYGGAVLAVASLVYTCFAATSRLGVHQQPARVLLIGGIPLVALTLAALMS